MKELVKLQGKSQYQEAVLIIMEFEGANERLIEADREADYLLQMEKGLCFLSMGDPSEALKIYSTLNQRGHDNAMLSFRIAEGWRLLGEFSKAKDYLELSLQKLHDGSSREKREIAWLENKLPLKLSYVLWKLDLVTDALAVLKKDYPRIEKLGDERVIREYLNSITYYELEAHKPHNPSSETCKKYKADFERYGLNSIDNVEPEFVDTYAWICYLAGDIPTAKSAIEQVTNALCFPDGPETTFIEHKGKRWPIAASDAKLIHYHAANIRRASV